MCSLCREIPAEVQEFDLILPKELIYFFKKAPLHEKSGGGWGAEGGSQRSVGWVLCVAAAGGSEVDLWTGGPVSGEGAAGKKSQMIKFPAAAVKGLLSTLGLKDGDFYEQSFVLCVNKAGFNGAEGFTV